MLHVYLDQNKWIDLARAIAGKASQFRDVVDLATEGVRLGILSFPLSAIHYMETWNHRKAKRRLELAAMMLRLSRPPRSRAPHTIAGPPEVVRMELDLALNARFGKPFFPRRRDIFGQGFGHAFGQPDYWFKVPQEAPFSADQMAHIEYTATRFIEAAMVSGPPQDLPVPGMIPGIDSEAYKRYSTRYVEDEARLVDSFRQLGIDRDERRRTLAARSFLDILNPLNDACARAGIQPKEFLTLGEEGVTAFLEDVPSRRVDFELHVLRFDNLQLQRKRGDLADFAALSVAVPYCDVVVTERLWVDLIKRARLDQLYDTTVLDDLRGLAPLMAAAV